MVRFKGKQRMYIMSGVIAVVVLAVIGLVVLVSSLGTDKKDPYKQVETTNTQDDTNTSDTSGDTETKPPVSVPESDDKQNGQGLAGGVDPANVSTVDIQPMSLTVSYLKDAGGFEYYVLRTANGTQYVEFSSPELVGTKCTDDRGVFASIIQSPSSSDTATLNKTTTVDGTKYGLSLADSTCTKDPEALKKYQAAFSDTFTMLKKLN